MKSTVIPLTLSILISTSISTPNILRNYWNMLTKSESECPELTEPPYKVNIPHETDCGKFYLCQRKAKIEMSCASFLEFNTKLGLCDWPNRANCVLEEKDYQYIEAYSEVPYVVNNKTECDRSESRKIAHEEFCNQYYLCVYGQKVLKICPDNMVFNNDKNRCDFTFNVVCESSSLVVDDYLGDYDYYDHSFGQTPDKTQQCGNKSKVFPHETKCNAYYRCAKGKKIEMICPGALEFNRELSICDWPDLDRCDVQPSSATSLHYDDVLK